MIEKSFLEKDLWGKWHPNYKVLEELEDKPEEFYSLKNNDFTIAQADESLKKLFNLYKPVISQKTSELNTPSIPKTVLESEIQKNIYESFKKYNPSKETSLFTFVNSRLPEVNRFVYNNQNVGRIPVHRVSQFGNFQRAEEELKDKLKRTPDNYELADYLKWPLKEVKRMRGEIRKDYVESAQLKDFSFNEFSDDEEFLHLLYWELDESEKAVYNRLLGTNGYKKIEKDGDIAADMKISGAMVSKIKKRIADKAKKYRD